MTLDFWVSEAGSGFLHVYSYLQYIHALETHSVDSYEDCQQTDPHIKHVHSYIASLPGSLLQNWGRGNEDPGNIPKKAVDFTVHTCSINYSELRISGLAFLPEIQKLFFNQLWKCSLCLFLLSGQNVTCEVNGHSEHNYSIVLISGEDLILATCAFWNLAIVTNPPICHDKLVNQQSKTLSKPPVNGCACRRMIDLMYYITHRWHYITVKTLGLL